MLRYGPTFGRDSIFLSINMRILPYYTVRKVRPIIQNMIGRNTEISEFCTHDFHILASTVLCID